MEKISKQLEELKNAPDYAMLMAGVHLLDAAATELLKAVLKNSPETDKLFTPKGGLSDLGNKLYLLSSIGAIHRHEYNDASILKRIRNKLAHTSNLEVLNDREIKGMLRELKFQKENSIDQKDRLFNCLHKLITSWGQRPLNISYELNWENREKEQIEYLRSE